MLPLKKSKHILRTALVLTSSYVPSSVISVDEHNYMGVKVSYTKGDETSMELKIESSIDFGVSYGQQSSLGSPSGGVSGASPYVIQFTSTGEYWIDVAPLKADTLRVSVKSTGGTPTGTCGMTAVTGWV